MKFTPTILFGITAVVVAIIAVVVVSLKNKEGFGQNYNEIKCKDYPGGPGPCYESLTLSGCGNDVPNNHWLPKQGRNCGEFRNLMYW